MSALYPIVGLTESENRVITALREAEQYAAEVQFAPLSREAFRRALRVAAKIVTANFLRRRGCRALPEEDLVLEAEEIEKAAE